MNPTSTSVFFSNEGDEESGRDKVKAFPPREEVKREGEEERRE